MPSRINPIKEQHYSFQIVNIFDVWYREFKMVQFSTPPRFIRGCPYYPKGFTQCLPFLSDEQVMVSIGCAFTHVPSSTNRNTRIGSATIGGP